MAVIQFGATGWITKRLGEGRTAIMAIAVAIAGCVVYALIPEGWMVFLIQPLVSPQVLVFPALNALMSRAVSPTEQGALQGTVGSMMALGSVGGPLILSQTLAHFTEPNAAIYFPGAAFILAAMLMSVALIVLTVEVRRRHAL